MKGHTPGPWKHAGTGIEARAFDGSWRWITPVVHGGSPEQATANRELMAAAPELLKENDALKQAEDDWIRIATKNAEDGNRRVHELEVRLAALEAENGRLREALVSVREHIESRRLLFAGVEPRDAKAQTCLDCRQSELAVFERAIFPPSPSEGAL